MRALRRSLVRLAAFITRRRDDGRLREEIEEHLALQTAENMRAGLSPAEARRQAVLKFGAVEALKEDYRDQQGLPLLEHLLQDIRQALRGLRRNPGFTAVAVLTLALGIGATTAIFSVVYGVLLKPLPFHEPDRLVGLYHRGPGVNLPVMNQGPATYFAYRDHQRVFEDIGAWDPRQISITGRGEPERVEALLVTDRTLPLLRVQPILGRLFSKEDDAPGSPRRVVLTYGYWRRTFGGAHDVIGRSLDIDGMPGEVVGVLPASFKFLRTDPAVLLPMQLDRAEARGVSFGFQAVARLKPGVTLSQANADVARMIPLVVEQFGGYRALRLEPNVRPLAQDVIGDLGRVLWILLATVGIVLLIACPNGPEGNRPPRPAPQA